MQTIYVLVSFLTCYIHVLSQTMVKATSYSNEWIVKTNISEQELSLLVSRHGYTVARKLIDDTYLLIHRETPKSSRQRAKWSAKALTTEGGKIAFAEQLEWNKRKLRSSSFDVQDAQWSNMWYMNRSIAPSMGVLEAWQEGYSGAGVTIAIVDDGVDYNHPDLINKYVESLSEDFYDNDQNPLPEFGDSHGTKCAGVALAEKNNRCVLGVAYDSKLVVHRMIGLLGATVGGEMSSLGQVSGIDILSNSWGVEDKIIFEGPSVYSVSAMERGCQKGRQGKGAIYVFAAGNGGFDDNCNCDGYVTSIYTIAINSISSTGQPPGYAEPCTSVLASTFSGPGGPKDNICSTDIWGGCTDMFAGTSASAPMAAGIFALLLEANPELTWRDVQELAVRTSSSDGLRYGKFKTNGAGRKVSDWFGYGILDAHAMITLGKSWTNLPEQHSCTSITDDTPRYIHARTKYRSINSTIRTDACNQTSNCVNSLEHVEVTVTFHSSYRGAVTLTLESPLGTVSDILTERSEDIMVAFSHRWTYMSVQFWGENPTGEWKLTMSIPSDWRQSVGSLRSWQLKLYGTGVGCYQQTTTTVTTTPEPCSTGNSKPCDIGSTTTGNKENSLSSNEKIALALGCVIGIPLVTLVIICIARNRLSNRSTLKKDSKTSDNQRPQASDIVNNIYNVNNHI